MFTFVLFLFSLHLFPFFQPRCQLRRFEVGPFIHSYEPTKLFRKVSWPTEDLSYFYLAYQQELMGVKICEKARIEWYFEDIAKISIVENTASNGDQLQWLWIQLNKPPLWTRKLDSSIRTRASWNNKNAVRRSSPPADLAEFFTDVRSQPDAFGLVRDTVSSDGRNIHLAVSSPRKTWEAHFVFPVHMRLFTNYDRTLVDQLRAQGPATLAPYADQPWYQKDPLCDNCDDNVTRATVRCMVCEENVCRACDLVLHKSSRKCGHGRLTFCVFSQQTIDMRAEQNPCTCIRIREAPCPCLKSRLFCLPSCRCEFPNLFNHGPQDELEQQDRPSQAFALAPATTSSSRPLRFTQKRKRTGIRKHREDTSLRNFVVQGRIDDNEGRNDDDEEEDYDMDEDD
jgi:hypothetical protein